MKNSISKVQYEQCYGCQACHDVCPQKCIAMVADSNGFLIPKINETKCIDCGLCLRVCPSNKKNIKKKEKIELYSLNIKDSNIREKSTSGGAFFAIAQYVISRGGYVYGVAFNDNFEAVHICAENMNEVQRCMKSKYIQSNMEGIYNEIAERTKSKLVLFSGTPCQVEALSRFPNVNRDNLILVDIICHGVPSPKLWRKYLIEKEKKYGKIKNIITRDKERYGSSLSETIIEFENGKEYREVLDKDDYMRAFMRGYSLRNTCYRCRYKGRNRKSDITIGDFITAMDYIQSANISLGMSLVIANSDKGQQIMQLVNDKTEVHRVYSKQPLLSDWTWGLSLPFRMQSNIFYKFCFEKNKSIERSIKKTELYLKLYDKMTLKQITLRIRHKLVELYYKYLFKL